MDAATQVAQPRRAIVSVREEHRYICVSDASSNILLLSRKRFFTLKFGPRGERRTERCKSMNPDRCSFVGSKRSKHTPANMFTFCKLPHHERHRLTDVLDNVLRMFFLFEWGALFPGGRLEGDGAGLPGGRVLGGDRVYSVGPAQGQEERSRGMYKEPDRSSAAVESSVIKCIMMVTLGL